MAVVLQLGAVVAWLVIAYRHPDERPERQRWVLVAPLLLLVASLAITGDLFLLRKWLTRLAMPYGWLVLALLVAATVAYRQGAKRRGHFTVAGLALSTVLGSPWVGSAALSHLEAPYAAVDPEALGPFEAVAVLGGGSNRAPSGRPQLSHAGDRLAVAAQMFHAGRTSTIICTGTSVAGLHTGEEVNLGNDSARLLMGFGVPREALLPVGGPTSTKEEIARLKRLVAERGITKLGIVTSAWHLRRATRLAAKADLDVVGIPADFKGATPLLNVVKLVPGTDGVSALSIATKEWLGMAMGR